MLPAVLQWNNTVNGDRQRDIASALQPPHSQSPARSAADAVKLLIRNLGLPTTLREVGVQASQLPVIAAAAAENSVVKQNPRPITSADDVMEVLQLAW